MSVAPQNSFEEISDQQGANEPATGANEQCEMKRSGTGGYGWLLLFPVAGAMLGWLATVLTVILIPKLYEAKAVVQVNELISGANWSGRDPGMVGTNAMTAIDRVATETEVMRAQKTMQFVIDDLELMKRWEMERYEVLTILDESVKAEPRPGTNLIEIRVVAKSTQDARMIGEAVVSAYQKRQLLRRGAREEAILAERADHIVRYEDLVEDKKKDLLVLVEMMEIPVVLGDGLEQIKFAHVSSLDKAEQVLSEMELEKVCAQMEIEHFLKLTGEKILGSPAVYFDDPRGTLELKREYVIEKKDKCRLRGIS